MAGLCPMRKDVGRVQTTILEYIVTHPIFELSTGLNRMTVSSRSLMLWKQNHIQKCGGSEENEGA